MEVIRRLKNDKSTGSDQIIAPINTEVKDWKNNYRDVWVSDSYQRNGRKQHYVLYIKKGLEITVRTTEEQHCLMHMPNLYVKRNIVKEFFNTEN